MEAVQRRGRKKSILFAVLFLVVNILAVLLISRREAVSIDDSLSGHAEKTKEQFEAVMGNYERSFQLFVQMMKREIENHPDPDEILAYLKSIDSELLEIEGDTFDGLYMYYQGRYLYSWSTPYSVYEESGYVATERPWYKDAVAGDGRIVFTPPYMSYANHYILTTISQMQPDKETVFAYDIKMGDIQELVSSMKYFRDEQIMVFDANGTLIGSTNADYLGGNLYATVEEAGQAVAAAQAELDAVDPANEEEFGKAGDKLRSSAAFHEFRSDLGDDLAELLNSERSVKTMRLNGARHYGYLLPGTDFSFMIVVPVTSALGGTLTVWLLPLLFVELLLIYILSRVSKDLKNRELKAAYVELGQTQKRLEIALSVAQRAAAVDDLTGMMNFKSFRSAMSEMLDSMEADECGILIMIDGDHFKQINDTYGHNIGDEVIKLSAQMIVGRIRTIDLASRLHGDEFAIFVSNTADYSVAQHIMQDINDTMAKEAKKRNMPSITLSSGAVLARHGDTFAELSKKADEVLYEAKKTHDGGFAHGN